MRHQTDTRKEVYVSLNVEEEVAPAVIGSTFASSHLFYWACGFMATHISACVLPQATAGSHTCLKRSNTSLCVSHFLPCLFPAVLFFHIWIINRKYTTKVWMQGLGVILMYKTEI